MKSEGVTGLVINDLKSENHWGMSYLSTEDIHGEPIEAADDCLLDVQTKTI